VVAVRLLSSQLVRSMSWYTSITCTNNSLPQQQHGVSNHIITAAWCVQPYMVAVRLLRLQLVRSIISWYTSITCVDNTHTSKGLSQWQLGFWFLHGSKQRVRRVRSISWYTSITCSRLVTVCWQLGFRILHGMR
jgi:hypothetical protein